MQRVAVRGLGQGLSGSGIQTELDARITLFDGTGHVAASNGDWAAGPRAGELAAAGLAPGHATDAALLLDLAPGAYTLHLAPQDAAKTGIGLVEVYDLGGDDTELINISTRGYVQPGDDILIAGFVLGGMGEKRVAIRALGKGLQQSGIASELDPVITVLNGAGQAVEVNDDWSEGTPEEIGEAFLVPPHEDDAGIVLCLPPGAYTVHVNPKDGIPGIGIVEVYDLDAQ
jgi:hypothetical protein